DGTHASCVLRKLTSERVPRLELIWADGKYNNRTLDKWLKASRARYRLEVVSRPVGAKGFVLLHRRWVVERSFAWLGRYRRHSRDYEWSVESSEAMLKVCSIHRMLRLLCPDQSKKPVPFKYRKLQAIIPG